MTDREKLIDELLAANPNQADYTPVILWGRIADFIMERDAKAEISRLETGKLVAFQIIDGVSAHELHHTFCERIAALTPKTTEHAHDIADNGRRCNICGELIWFPVEEDV